MKIFSLILMVFLFSFQSQGGVILAEDSLQNGVLKIEKTSDTTIMLHRCDMELKYCKFIGSKDISVIDRFIDYGQIAGSAFVQIAPSAFFGLAAAINHLYFQVIAGSVLTGFTSLYLKITTNIKSLNLVRLYDYSNLNNEKFLTSKDAIIAFPDDTLDEIISEIL